METTKPSLFQSALKYGLILGGIAVLFSLLLYSFGQMQNKILGYLFVVLMLGVILWAIKDFRDKKLGGFISFKSAFGLGFQTGLVAAIIGSVYSFLFFKFFDPDMISLMLVKAEESLIESNPNKDESQIEMAMGYTRKFMTPVWMAIWGIIFNIIAAAVVSLIAAAIMKKEADPMMPAGE